MFLYLSMILFKGRGVLCPGGFSAQVGLCPGGSLSGRPPIRLYAHGTHPTGMHSCFLKKEHF